MPKPPRKPAVNVSPARFEAFTILMEIERSASVHADDLLRGPRVTALTAQDRNLCTALVLGTLRWQIRLDAAIRTLLSKPNAKLDSPIRIALRLGLFQLHFLDRIPAHAAIGESVSLARLAGHQQASRMVNAVLRMLSQGPRPDFAALPDSAVELAAATAHPKWFVERWIAHYGMAAAQAICRNGQRQPELTLRLDHADAEQPLLADGIQLAPAMLLRDARRVLSGDVTATEAFRSGQVRIQEEGSQLIAELAGSGSRILDCCAAPGGKTLLLAARNPEAQITALEVSPARCEALRKRVAASAWSSQITIEQADAAEISAQASYDLVLVDAPCSGTGTLGRNPEIRHRLEPAGLARHHDRQCAILRAALRAGSHRVIYSTCSLEPEENAEVVRAVLCESPEWRQVSLSDRVRELEAAGILTPAGAKTLAGCVAEDGSLMLLPGCVGSGQDKDGYAYAGDGFYIAMLEKRA